MHKKSSSSRHDRDMYSVPVAAEYGQLHVFYQSELIGKGQHLLSPAEGDVVENLQQARTAHKAAGREWKKP